MPTVSIGNETPFVLNLALSQLAPLHFQNEVQPGEDAKFQTGAVWFTLSVRIDSPRAKNRFTNKERIVKVAACAVGGAAVGGALLAGLWFVLPAAGIAEGVGAVGAGSAAGASAASKLLAGGAAKLSVAKVAVQRGHQHYKKHRGKYDTALSQGQKYLGKHVDTALAAGSAMLMMRPGKAGDAKEPSLEPATASDVKAAATSDEDTEELVRVLDSRVLVLQVHALRVPFKGRRLQVRMLEGDGSLVLWDLEQDEQVK